MFKKTALGIAAISVLALNVARADYIAEYESVDVPSPTVMLHLPYLDLDTVKSATFKAVFPTDFNSNPLLAKSIKNFKLTFENAAPLVVPELKLADGNSGNPGPYCNGQRYIADVNHQWAFQALSVAVCVNVDRGDGEAPFEYSIAVKTSNNWTGTSPYYPPFDLVRGPGYAQNVTPNPLADTLRLDVAGKSLQINLLKEWRDTNEPQTSMPNAGYQLKLSWLGHGDCTLSLPIAGPEFDAVALTHEQFDPTIELGMLRLRLVDMAGNEFEAPEVFDLRQLLEDAYGPIQGL